MAVIGSNGMGVNKEDEYHNFEEWEADSNFFDEKDWKGLVVYRRRKAENNPDDQYDQFKLGEAYVLNKEYEKAISFLSALHQKYADDQNIQYSLLDALFAIGKDETVIDWIIRPTVLRLSGDILDYCYNFLRTKRKPRMVYDLYLELYMEGYLVFDDDQLMDFLHSDNRFTFSGNEAKSYDCFVTVKRKKDVR